MTFEPLTSALVASTTVLYDADCRFCRVSMALLLAWDRDRRLQPVPLQSAEAARLLPDLGPEGRMASMHAVPAGGPPASGGEAFAPLLRQLPGGAPLAPLAERFPRAAEIAYAGVADNRTFLSKLVPETVSRRADALLSRRLRPSPAH